MAKDKGTGSKDLPDDPTRRTALMIMGGSLATVPVFKFVDRYEARAKDEQNAASKIIEDGFVNRLTPVMGENTAEIVAIMKEARETGYLDSVLSRLEKNQEFAQSGKGKSIS